MTILVGFVLAGTLAVSHGWPVLAAAGAMVAIVVAGGTRLERRRRPELWVFYSTVVNIQVLLAVGTVLTGPQSGLAATLAVPVVLVAARFSNRGLVVGAPVSALLVVAVTAGADPGYVVAHPEALGIPLALVFCSAVYLSPLVASDVRHRADSTLDQLTGLLNRRALEPRFAEIAEQAALTGQPVSLVIADIDHFKWINDRHGHAVGDAVLRDVAYAMRRSLRNFELLYRLGGEEFLLLLPGASEDHAAEIAEKLRLGIEGLRPIGIPVACSLGVATASGGEVAFAPLMRAADSALYDAKRCGRNRVQRSPGPTVAQPAYA